MKLLHRVVLAALLCLSVPAWAQDGMLAQAANPTLLAKSILALRGDERDRTQLQLVFDRRRDGEALPPLTVWIGADYFALIDGERATITDLRLRRRFVVDRRAGTLVNFSLYGDVMFRRVELVRRIEIATALTKEPDHVPLPESLDRFWIESELGIASADKLPAAMAPKQDGDTTQFFYGKQKVAAVTPSDTAIPRGLGHSYAMFLRRTLPLHPSIARWLGETGHAPKQLDFVSEARGKAEKMTLRLHSATTIDADFPMPPHLTLVLLPWGTNDPDVALMREILPHITEAIAQHAGADRATKIAEARAAIARDFKEGHKFAAALRLTELALRWGRSATECDAGKDAGSCLNKQDIDRTLRTDQRSVAMFKATALQDHQPAKALTIWRGLDRNDVPNGYVVDIFLARLLSERGDRAGAAHAFAAAFAGDAGIVALYRELGDHFARVSRLDLAWLCYDLGRALPNRTVPDALSAIDDVERDLAEAYPDLF